LCLGLLLTCALFTACQKKEEIKVYRVSKAEPETSVSESPSARGMPPAAATIESGNQMTRGMPPAASSMVAGLPPPPTSQVTGTPPSNWESQPLSSMRQLSYVVKGQNGALADISLVILAGSAGGVLDNVNRWLSQLGQPGITEGQLAKMTRHQQSSLGDVTIVDLEGLPQGADAAKDGRIVAGIAFADNRTFFFKMRGNALLTESQKEPFVRWIGTIRMDAPASAPGPTAAPAANQDNPPIKWDVPGEWKPVAPSSMRYASFAVAGQDGESADISASVFAGNGGGDLENVNRWRAQIALEAIADADLKALIIPVACKDGQIFTVDMNGPKSRILAGWARVAGKSWFFKLIAPTQLADREKAAFVKFLQSVQFHP